jgi:hypothetical protein
VVGRNNAAVWNADNPGYIFYAEKAKELGLKSGRDFNDSVHVQYRKARSPLHDGLTLKQVNDEMEKRFGKHE